MQDIDKEIQEKLEKKTFKSEDVERCSINYKKKKDISKLNID